MSGSARRRVAVIGGGISGLAAAHRLIANDTNLDVTVFEASDRLGGKIMTEQVDGFTIEAGPDAFLATKPRGIGLSRELGLESAFRSPDPAMQGSFVFRNGQLHRLPEGLTGLIPTRLRPMAETRLISPLGKLRMALDFVLPARRNEEDESLAAFLTRRLGQEPFRNLIEPLMAGIYAGDAAQLSLAATFPQLRDAERRHGGLIRGVIANRRRSEKEQPASSLKGFIGFEEGMQTLVTALQEKLIAADVTFVLNAPIEAITRTLDVTRHSSRYGYKVLTVSGQTHDMDAIVIATPAWAAAPLLANLDPDAGQALSEIPHVSTALIVLAFPDSDLPHPDRLQGYGYVVPRSAGRDVMAMTWLSSKWQGRSPGGQILVRGFAGRAGQEEVFARDDDALVELMRRELVDVLGITTATTLQRVFRWDRGMPQYTLGHLDRVRRIESGIARLPDLALAGNMLHGVGIPDAIASGERAADSLTASSTSR